MDKNSLVTSKIKEIRKYQNYTSEFVSESLGISLGAYSNLENGKVEITIKKLYTLSKILNASVIDLLSESGSLNQISHGEYAQNINCSNFYNGNYAEIDRLHKQSIENIVKANELIRKEK